MADIFILLKCNTLQPIFTLSRRIEIDDLLQKSAFEVFAISDVQIGMRILNSHFKDEIKNEGTATILEKLGLVVQAYNDHGIEAILTQSPTIQHMSQRFILAFAAWMQ